MGLSEGQLGLPHSMMAELRDTVSQEIGSKTASFLRPGPPNWHSVNSTRFYWLNSLIAQVQERRYAFHFSIEGLASVRADYVPGTGKAEIIANI